jgi:hypothetical protein
MEAIRCRRLFLAPFGRADCRIVCFPIHKTEARVWVHRNSFSIVRKVSHLLLIRLPSCTNATHFWIILFFAQSPSWVLPLPIRIVPLLPPTPYNRQRRLLLRPSRCLRPSKHPLRLRNRAAASLDGETARRVLAVPVSSASLKANGTVSATCIEQSRCQTTGSYGLSFICIKQCKPTGTELRKVDHQNRKKKLINMDACCPEKVRKSSLH